jgi:predicted nucleic acid-binding protein
MKRVVSNATPLRYLAEIGALQLLPYLFGNVVIPTAVEQELTHRHAPECVRNVILSPPEWLDIRAIQQADARLATLDPGEREAITLASELGIDIVLLDEKMARDVSTQRGLRCIGTLRILAEGAKQGQITLRDAIERLRRTTFRVHPALLDRVLKGLL